MSTVTFDTLKLATRLEQSGFTAEQARGAETALSEVFIDDVVTKSYFDMRIGTVKSDLEAKIKSTKAEILKWMFGVIGSQTLVILGAVLALSRFGH